MMVERVRVRPWLALRHESLRIEGKVRSAIAKRQAVHEDELLARTELGPEVLSLRLERDNLLDTVWLATSPKQVRDLWQEVDELLGGGQTKLQREALAIDPPKED